MGEFDILAGAIELDATKTKRFQLTRRDILLLRDAVCVIAPMTPAETKAVDRLRRILNEACSAPAG